MKNAQVAKAAAVETKAAAPAVKKAPAAPKKAAAKKAAAPAKADPMASIVNSAATVEKIKAEDKAATPVKKARTTRPAQKPVAAAPSVVVAAAAVLPIKFVFTGARPTAGRTLFAYTEAIFTLLGMYKGGAADRAVLTALMGGTAVAYHIKQGNLDKTSKGIEITVDGLNTFKRRAAEGKFDPKDVDAYMAILATGQMDNRLVKNQGMIKELSV